MRNNLKTENSIRVELLFVITLLLLFLASFMLFQRIQNTGELVSSVSDGLTNESQNAAFSSPFRFTAAGDFGAGTDARRVLSGIRESESEFSLALGDLGYVGIGNEPAWCEFVTDLVGNEYPFQLVVGNHDDGRKGGDGDFAAYAACLPDRLGGLTGEYGVEYYFDYNHIARFILISPDINNYGFDYAKGDEHYRWVRDAIDDAREQDISWVILGMHKNCITAGTKKCEIGEDILNLAIEKKVDIVLQAHDHGYYRSKQLALSDQCLAIEANSFNEACVVAEGSAFTQGEGTIIVISGAGGRPLRTANPNDSEIGYFDAWNGRNIGKTHGFNVFDVKKRVLQAEFEPVGAGEFSDSFVILPPREEVP